MNTITKREIEDEEAFDGRRYQRVWGQIEKVGTMIMEENRGFYALW